MLQKQNAFCVFIKVTYRHTPFNGWSFLRLLGYCAKLLKQCCALEHLLQEIWNRQTFLPQNLCPLFPPSLIRSSSPQRCKSCQLTALPEAAAEASTVSLDEPLVELFFV